MKLLLRGHIRNAFDTDDLYNVLQNIHRAIGLEIYIHTWNVFSSSVSWRPIVSDNRTVTEAVIYDYFRDLAPHIKLLKIDDDTTIQLKGRLEGNISKSYMPIHGWKNMLYGMFWITDAVINDISNNDETVATVRFDILTNRFGVSSSYLYTYFIKNTGMRPNNLVFAHGNCSKQIGCDNLIWGNISILHKLLFMLTNHLDDILARSPAEGNQEFYFIHEYNYLFNCTPSQSSNLNRPMVPLCIVLKNPTPKVTPALIV
jgi:AraC-like DNA-binding protein